MKSDAYLVNQEVLLHLLARDAALTALENEGVDNWIGYENAYRINFEEIAKNNLKVFQKYDIYEDDLK
jgi:hypothetical protein